jgi:hypothetical protein
VASISFTFSADGLVFNVLVSESLEEPWAGGFCGAAVDATRSASAAAKNAAWTVRRFAKGPQFLKNRTTFILNVLRGHVKPRVDIEL